MLVNVDFWLAASGLGLSGITYWIARDYPEGAGFFPIRTAILLGVACACLLAKSLKEKHMERLNADWQAVGVVLFSGAYLWSLTCWGYILSTTLFFFCTTLMLGFRRYILTTLVSIGFSMGVYLLFTRLLSVPLPRMTGGLF